MLGLELLRYGFIRLSADLWFVVYCCTTPLCVFGFALWVLGLLRLGFLVIRVVGWFMVVWFW